MGDVIKNIFSNVGGNAAKRDRGEQLNSYTGLRNVFNWALPTAQKDTATGQAQTGTGLSDAMKGSSYFQKLMGGSRSDVLGAVAPEAAGIRQASDASARELASSGTARGGGVAGANQDRQAKTQAQLSNLIFGVRPSAAEKVADIGTKVAQVGLGQQDAGLKAGQIGEESQFDLGKLAATNRPANEEIHQKHVDQMSKLFEEALTMAMNV